MPEFIKENSFQNILEDYLNTRNGGYNILDSVLSRSSYMFSTACTVLYGAWAYKLQGLYDVTQLEYDPIENYRMTEHGTDTDGGKDILKKDYGDNDTTDSYGKQKRTDTLGQTRVTENIGESSGNSTNVHGVSAFDKTGFTDESQNTESRTEQARTNSTTGDEVTNTTEYADYTVDRLNHSHTDTETQDYGKSVQHELTRSGNIGVTTSQQMAESERQLRDFSIYEVICDLIVRNLCCLLVDVL